VLTEIARVLKPGGRVGVSDVVAEDHLIPDRIEAYDRRRLRNEIQIGDLERLENDLVLRFMPERVGDFHRDFAALERIVVDPLGRVGWALRDCSEELRIDVETDLPWQDVLLMLDLRDDPHRSGEPGTAQRRGDPHAQRGFLARDWARGGADCEKRGDCCQLPATSYQLPVQSRPLQARFSLPASCFQLPASRCPLPTCSLRSRHDRAPVSWSWSEEH